jgi:arylsulfatase A-like enzyme
LENNVPQKFENSLTPPSRDHDVVNASSMNHNNEGKKTKGWNLTILLSFASIVGISFFLVQSNRTTLLQFVPLMHLVEQQQYDSIALSAKTPESEVIKCVNETCSSGAKQRDPHKPLNILLLYADDWRHDTIGVASNGVVRTPFLDALAKRGIRFTHNCVTTAVCWISRATLYMGQYMSRHNTTTIRKPYFYQHWNDSFVRRLQTDGGYHAGHVGKWHFYEYQKIESLWNFSISYHGLHWYPQRKGKPIHVTKRNENDALQFLKERPKDVPFFLGVCFFAPHSVDNKPEQYFPQPTSMEWYANETIPMNNCSATDEAWKKMPRFFGNGNEGRVRWRWRFETEEKYQTMMKNYYRLVSEVDETSERIVQELEDQGILNDTLVIFTTDNGLFHAEHGLAGKWYPHQESIRVPLIILDPRMPPDLAGSTMDDFTLSVDLAPTMLSAANLKPSSRMQGRDMAELYLEQVQDWRYEFFYEHPTHIHKGKIPGSTALVRKEWKYMRWTDFEQEQLFDLKADPYELEDLVGNESHLSILEAMRIQHNKLQALAV